MAVVFLHSGRDQVIKSRLLRNILFHRARATNLKVIKTEELDSIILILKILKPFAFQNYHAENVVLRKTTEDVYVCCCATQPLERSSGPGAVP